MSRLASVAVALTIAAVVSWAVWPSSILPAPSGHEASSAHGSVQPGDGADRDSQALVRREARASAQIPRVMAEPVWVDVTVVDAATKAPVGGAEVWWGDSSLAARVDALPAAEREVYRDDSERIARDFGWRRKSDAHGLVRVHAHIDGTEVLARAGRLFGSVDVRPEDWDRGARLELVEDRNLRLRVVDCHGQAAAGVPVAIVGDLEDAERWRQLAAQDADREGKAVFPHVQWLAPHVRAPVKDGSRPLRCYMAVCLPGITGPWREFDGTRPPDEEVTLVLPPTGALTVRVVDHGTPISQLSSCQLTTLDRDPGPDGVTWIKQADPDGAVRFSALPPGRVFGVLASLGLKDLWSEVTGPAAAGQQAFATIEIPDDWIVLAGRILATDGVPLAGSRLTAFFASTHSGDATSIVTDDQGGFVLFLDRSSGDLQRLVLTGWVAGESMRAVIGPRPLSLGRNDLGDIRLQPQALVVAGRFVLDRPSSMQPDLQVQQWIDGSGADRGWARVDDLIVNRDDQRCFEVRGQVPAGRLRLCCESDRHLPVSPIEFPPGKGDLVVPIELGASLELECGLPEGLRADALSFELESSTARGIGDHRLRPRASQSGNLAHLVWSAIWSGTYSLQVRLAGERERGNRGSGSPQAPGIVMETTKPPRRA